MFSLIISYDINTTRLLNSPNIFRLLPSICISNIELVYALKKKVELCVFE